MYSQVQVHGSTLQGPIQYSSILVLESIHPSMCVYSYIILECVCVGFLAKLALVKYVTHVPIPLLYLITYVVKSCYYFI